MRFYTEILKDDFSGKWYVECGIRSPNFTELGTVSDGNTKATAMRKAARSFESQAKKLRKESFKFE